jgi:1,5-anhydro-D-fructose reductase (1,5-anhydro-D-mannitol-forming)
MDSEKNDAASAGWGVVGASAIAREYVIDAIRRTGGVPLWLTSRSDAHRTDFAHELGIPHHSAELADMLADERVKAVYISSINSLHREQVIKSARAGKHILCDKPLATRAADALKMVKACDKAGVVLAVNHHLRSSPVHQTMRRMIAAGDIGEVRSLIIVHAGLLRPTLQTWRIKDPDEGAIYLDLSVHDIDLASFLLQQQAQAAIGIGDALALGVAETHDHTMYALRMSGGAFVQVHESFVTPDVESQVMAYGSDGILIASGTLAQKSTGTLIRRTRGRNESIPLRANDIYADTVEQFLAAIEGRGEPRATGRDGLASLVGAEAVARAVKTRKSVEIKVPE